MHLIWITACQCKQLKPFKSETLITKQDNDADFSRLVNNLAIFIQVRYPSPIKKGTYRENKSSELKKKQRQGRVNSLPELEVPSKSSQQQAFKRPAKQREPERRLSDVSTIGLEDKPVFRPIRGQEVFKKPKSGDSTASSATLFSHHETGGSPYGPKKPVAAAKSLKKIQVASPQSTSGYANKAKGPPRSGGSSELSFTNIATVKSATNSVQSTRSNFEINAKYVKHWFFWHSGMFLMVLSRCENVGRWHDSADFWHFLY